MKRFLRLLIAVEVLAALTGAPFSACFAQQMQPKPVQQIQKLPQGLSAALRNKINPVPLGSAPRITGITPIEPDYTPYVRFGEKMTVAGQNFAANNPDNYIVISPYTQPANPSKGPDTSVAELNPQITLPGKLEVIAPTLASGSGRYYVWVATTRGGWSNPVAVTFAPAAFASAVISAIDPQYPALKTTVHGSNFRPSAHVVFGPRNSLTGDMVETRYLDSSRLQITLPGGIAPGVYSARVAMDNANPSAPADLTVLTPLPLNLYWPLLDQSGDPFNPKWGAQLIRKERDPGYFPDVRAIAGCPPGSDCGPKLVPPVCSQPTAEDDAILCCIGTAVGLSGGCGHVNWMAATYEGTLWWSEHDGNDDDYNFYLYTPEAAGSTQPQARGIKLEFDSDETIDAFDGTWWDTFHNAVDQSNQAANALVWQKKAVVTGLFGIDCAHACDTEIHPVWAMAINTVPGNPLDDRWAMFVRNWGNEGFCSSTDWRALFPNNRYTVRIPWRQGATGVQLASTDFRTYEDAPATMSYSIAANDAVCLHFNLPDPYKHPLVWGNLSLKWAGNMITPYSLPLISAQAAGAAARQGKESSAEDMFRSMLRNAPPEKRQAFETQFNAIRKSKLPAQRRSSVRIATVQAVAPEAKPVPPTRVAAEPDAAKRERDRRTAQALYSSGIITAAERDRILSKRIDKTLPKAVPQKPQP